MDPKLLEIAQRFYIRKHSIPQILKLVDGLCTPSSLYRARKTYDWDRDREMTAEKLKLLKSQEYQMHRLLRDQLADLRDDEIPPSTQKLIDEKRRCVSEITEIENWLQAADADLEEYRFERMTEKEQEVYLRKMQLKRGIRSGSAAGINAYINLKKSQRNVMRETIEVFRDLMTFLNIQDPEFLRDFIDRHWFDFIRYLVKEYRKQNVEINSEELEALVGEKA